MIELWTIAIAVMCALTCALAGSFLVLKRESLVSEGLAHAVLPGIVLAFVVTRDRTSPLLIVGAAGMGLAMVLLVKLIRRTGIVDRDASLGVVFPALFSFGVLLANAELSQTHFHADCIIDGNLSLAVLDRFEPFGHDLGPRSFWALSVVFSLVTAFLAVFFKELKLMTFDAGLARSLGLRPHLLHVAWLFLVSIATVTAFETAGSILVVALMIAPPAAASLWTHDLRSFLVLAALFGAIAAVFGFYTALGLDVAPAGPIATLAGVVFVLSFAFAPRGGALTLAIKRHRRRRDMDVDLLLARFKNDRVRGAGDVHTELEWPKGRWRRAVERAIESGTVTRAPDGALECTAFDRPRVAT